MGILNNHRTSKEETINKLLSENDAYNGIPCTAVLPEKQLKSSSKSGTTKGLATLGFGVIGLAATSGVSQNEENREIDTIFQIVPKGIVLKNGKIDGGDLRIPFEDIIHMESVDPNKGPQLGLITLIENKRLILKKPKYVNNEIIAGYRAKILFEHISNIINNKACGINHEEPGWGLKSNKNSSNEYLLENLERLEYLRSNGVLTSDEFDLIKERIISDSNDDEENKVMSCLNCGQVLNDDELFCPQCGTKNDNLH